MAWLSSVLLLVATTAVGGENAPRTVRVGGAAGRTVEAQVVEAVFALATQSGSFSAAASELGDLREQLVAELLSSCDPAPELEVESRAPGEEPLAWTTRPKPLEHRLRVSCTPRGGRPEVAAAALLDAALAVDPGLTVVEVSSALSIEADRRIREEILAEAVTAARRQARAVAAAAGARVVGVVSIEPLGQAAVFRGGVRGLAASPSYRAGARFLPPSGDGVTVQRGSSGEAHYSSTLHYAVRIAAVFAVEPE